MMSSHLLFAQIEGIKEKLEVLLKKEDYVQTALLLNSLTDVSKVSSTNLESHKQFIEKFLSEKMAEGSGSRQLLTRPDWDIVFASYSKEEKRSVLENLNKIYFQVNSSKNGIFKQVTSYVLNLASSSLKR